MPFTQPAFWTRAHGRAMLPHATSVVVTPPVFEPLTLTQAKLRAGLDWASGDARDELMTGFIAAARAKVEHDTGLALATQTRDVFLDAWPTARAWALPAQSQPLQSVTSITTYNDLGVAAVFPATDYDVDAASGRIGLASDVDWPSDLRPTRPIVIRLVSGYVSVEAIPPMLRHAVGLLVAHYANTGRDLAVVGTIVSDVPYGYEDAIGPYRLMTFA